MGPCAVSNRHDTKNPIKIDISQNNSQFIAEQYPLPKPKVRLEFSQMQEQYEQIPIIHVTDSMAYNFIVRQGVNQQKQNKKEVDYCSVYLYSEKAKINFFDYGFIPIDVSRLDRIVTEKKQYKFLFDFKVVWIFRDYAENLKSILNVFKEINVKVKQIHLFPKPLEKFMDQFKMLTEVNIINSFYPLLQFDSKDVIDTTKRNEDSFRVYLHNNDALELLIKNNQISLYNDNLQVRNIIFLYANVNFNEQKKLEENLYKLTSFSLTQQPQGTINTQILIKEFMPYIQKLQQMGSNVVLIYSNTENQALKIARLAIEQYMVRELLIFPEDIQKYNDELRSLYIKPTQIIQNQEIKSSHSQVSIMSREQEMTELYEKWLKKIKSTQLLQSSHNLIVKLITNIIDNAGADKFRAIQKTNKTINLNILQYEEGKQMLQLVGFNEGENEMTNIFEIGQLKFARADIEIAWKKQLEKSLK